LKRRRHCADPVATELLQSLQKRLGGILVQGRLR